MREMTRTLAELIRKEGPHVAKVLAGAKIDPDKCAKIEQSIHKGEAKLVAARELEESGRNDDAKEARIEAVSYYIEAAKEARANYTESRNPQDLERYAQIKATAITINEEIIQADEKQGIVDEHKWAEISKHRSETATAYKQAKNTQDATEQYIKAEKAADNAAEILLGKIETLRRAVERRKEDLQQERIRLVKPQIENDGSKPNNSDTQIEEIDREIRELDLRSKRERITYLEKIAQMQKLRSAAFQEIAKQVSERENWLKAAATASIRVADQYREIVAIRVKGGDTIKIIEPLIQIGEAVARAADFQEQASNDLLALGHNAQAASAFMRAAQTEFQLDWDSPSTSERFRNAVERATQIKMKILETNDEETVGRIVVATIMINAAAEFRHEESLEVVKLSEEKILGAKPKTQKLDQEIAKVQNRILGRKAENQHNLGQYEEAENTVRELMEIRCKIGELEILQKEREIEFEIARSYKKTAGNWLNSALGEISKDPERAHKSIRYANAHAAREEIHLMRAIEKSTTKEQKIELIEEVLAQAKKILAVVKRAGLKDHEEVQTRKIERMERLIAQLRK